MKKVLIAYSSLTGNTKMVAEAILEVFGEDVADILPIKEVNSIADYEVVIPGFWVDRGTADTLAKKFIEEIKNKKVALFGTLGADPNSPHGISSMENVKNLLDGTNELLGTFLCQGKVDPKVIAMMEKMFGTSGHSHSVDENRRKRHMEASSHPDENDLNNAKKVFTQIRDKI